MKIKSKNGITLITLVITIIIMLILVGIVITMAVSENGLITKAQLAGKNYLIAQNQEEHNIAKLGNEIEGILQNSRETITISKDEYDKLINNIEYKIGDTISFSDPIGFIGFSNNGGSIISFYIPLKKELSSEITSVSVVYKLQPVDCNGTRYQSSNFNFYSSTINSNNYIGISFQCKSYIHSMQACKIYFDNLTITFN